MKSKVIISLLTVFICVFITATSNAQKVTPWVINDVPLNESNDRFYNDISSQINRPALSMVGFDNGGDHSKGYGLKQILNQAYVNGLNSNEQKDIIIDVIDIASGSIYSNPSSREQYQANSNILQYRAFEALASYVLEQNGKDPNSFCI